MSAPPKPNPETARLILEHVRDALERQIATVEAQGKKALALFSAGSVVIGLGAVSTARGDAKAGIIAAALVAYFICGIATLFAAKNRDLRVARHADQIWLDHWDSSPEDFVHATVADIADGYKLNHDLLSGQAKAVGVVLTTLFAEVVLVGIAVIAAAA